MSAILGPWSPSWRKKLRQASFKGAAFHVDQIGRSSGRRVVVHEYPKRDIPYSEDMGRVAFRYQITGYVLQCPPGNARGSLSPDYDVNRDNLQNALLSPGPGTLIDPYNPILMGVGLLYMCDRFTDGERREQGGYAFFDMSFVEAGLAAFSVPSIATGLTVDRNANTASTAASGSLDSSLAHLNG
jgi:hypothetical protein